MSETNKLKKHLEEDLTTLHDLLIQAGPLPPRHVRSVGSAIVRKWLIDGNLNQLGHELELNFEFPAYDTSAVFAELTCTPEIKFFLAGGIILGGIEVRSIYASSANFTGCPTISVQTQIKKFTPGKYLGSKRIYFEGNSFSAEQIISFVANKHGGVHFDQTRDKPWQEHLERAAGYMTFGNPNHDKESKLIELSDDPGGPCMIVIPAEKGNIWNSLDIELLSAAQALLNVHVNGQRLLITEAQTDKTKPWWRFW